MNSYVNAPTSYEQLTHYRDLVMLETRFSIPPRNTGDPRAILRKAILEMWSPTVEADLNIHLPTFLEHIAKDISTLRQLLQLTSQVCAIKTLNDDVLKLVDCAYASAGTSEHDDNDLAKPTEIHRLSGTDYLLIYSQHHDTASDATVCLCTEDFSVPPDDYRSYRINALAGPRVRYDCSSIKKLLSTKPRAIATRGYFSAWRFIIQCRRPYADSELAMSQRLRIREAYLDVLELAFQCKAESVSFPLICPPGSVSTVCKAYRTAIEAVATARSMGWRFRTVHITGVTGKHESASRSALSGDLGGLPTFL